MVGPTKMSRTTGASTSKQNGGSSLHHCDVCGKDFPFKVVLDMHKKDHVFKNHFKCDLCESAYPKKSQLEMHYRKHTGERPYKCDESGCDAAFMNSSNLQRHKRKHVNKRRYDTDEWEAAYTLSDNLSAEKKRKNGDNDVDDDDDVIFTEVGIVKKYRCSECDESYSSLNALTLHKRKHSAERPFSCDECGAMFAVRASLDYHKLKHDQGGKLVKDTSYWNNTCNICKESFTSKDGLMQHSRKHTGARPFNYDKYFAAFSNSTSGETNGIQESSKLLPVNPNLNPQITTLHQQNSYHQPNLIQQHQHHIPQLQQQQQQQLNTQVTLQQQQPQNQQQMQCQPLHKTQLQPLQKHHQLSLQQSQQHMHSHMKHQTPQQQKQQKLGEFTNSKAHQSSNLDLHELQPPQNLEPSHLHLSLPNGNHSYHSQLVQISDVNGLPGPMGPQAQPVVSNGEAKDVNIKIEPRE